MRIEKVEIYSFDELSEKAKEKAVNNAREKFDYPWHDENVKVLKGFCEMFGISLNFYEYDQYNYVYRFSIKDEDIEKLNGKRLYKYINNNFAHIIKEHNAGKSIISGYYLESVIVDIIEEYLKKTSVTYEYNELMNEIIDELFWTMVEHTAYYYSYENISNELSELGHEFLKDGSRW